MLCSYIPSTEPSRSISNGSKQASLPSAEDECTVSLEQNLASKGGSCQQRGRLAVRKKLLNVPPKKILLARYPSNSRVSLQNAVLEHYCKRKTTIGNCTVVLDMT